MPKPRRGTRVRKASRDVFERTPLRVVRIDGFLNDVSGFGTSRDKSISNRFTASRLLDDETAEALYVHNSEAARIVDLMVNDAMGKGYRINIPDDAGLEMSEAVMAAAEGPDGLSLSDHYSQAWAWARTFGTGVTFMRADDGANAKDDTLKEPLNEEGIRTIGPFETIDKQFIRPWEFVAGQPETYIVTAAPIRGLIDTRNKHTRIIHRSRLIVAEGVRTPMQTRAENSGATSVLQRINKILYDFGMSWDVLSTTLQDSQQAVMRIGGLIEAYAEGDTAALKARALDVDRTRSNIRMLLLDSDPAHNESFERQDFDWAGIKEPYELLILRLAMAAGYPTTILLGQSPSGLNATGEADLAWHYKNVESEQRNRVRPALMRMLKLLMLSKDGPTSGVLPPQWDISFEALRNMTPLEQADVELKTAQRDAIYHVDGVLTPDETALSRFTPRGWSQETTIDREEREANALGDPDEDIANTPRLGGGDEAQEPAKAALTAQQTLALAEISKEVAGGTLKPEQAVAIVLVSHPDMDTSVATAIVGQPDPEQIAQRQALTQGLAQAGDDEGDDEPPEE